MPRVAASLLIALVGLMALLPQAMCPCAVRGRAEALRAEQASASAAGEPVAARPCCTRCRPRVEAPAPRGPVRPECPDVGDSCPCCEVNGGGKYLVPLGDVVRLDVASAAPDFLAFAVVPAPLLAQRSPEVAPAARPSADPSPFERRAGVVLLI